MTYCHIGNSEFNAVDKKTFSVHNDKGETAH